MQEKQEKRRMGVVQSMLYTIQTIWKADKGCIIYSFYKNCTEEVFNSFFVIYLMQYIYTSIENGTSYEGLVRILIIFASLHIVIHLASAGHAYYIRLRTPKVYGSIFRKVVEKAKTIDLARYEQPDFYDRFSKALDECLKKAMDGLRDMTYSIGCILGTISALLLIINIDPVLVLFLVPPVIASFWCGGKVNKLQYELREKETREKRISQYVTRIFYEKKYASEIRLYNIRKLLFKKYKESYNQRYNIYKTMYRKINFYSFLQSAVLLGITMLSAYVYVTVIIKGTGAVKIGAYITVLGSIDFVCWKVRSAVRNAIKAGRSCIYMNNLQDFFEYESKEMKNGSRHVEGELGDIDIENITFTYEGAAVPTISNLTLHIKKGEKVALVGENGAGKTTLIKLLMGLYPISNGEIRINQVPVQEYEQKEFHQHFGTVFQDLQIFALPLAENVLMRKPKNEQERLLVVDALRKAQFGDKLDTLTEGIDSMVTKEFDDKGFVCSGGQAQKIAIARVFAKNPDIVVLDEPSSALDPVAEYNMYQNMLQASEGKTVFFISHRLSSARIADKIYFLEHGRIVEEGSHDELMAQNGQYARMFQLQAKSYQESVPEHIIYER